MTNTVLERYTITNGIAQGEGLWVFSGDTITGTQPFTIDITGPPNTGTIPLKINATIVEVLVMNIKKLNLYNKEFKFFLVLLIE